MKLKKLATSALLAGSFLFALASTAQAAEEVKISGFTWPGYGFWFIAKDQNLSPNLDINYQTIEDPYESYNLVTADRMDVVSSTVEFSPIAAERGMPLKLVAFANLSYGTDKIVVAPGIDGPADLKGKKVRGSGRMTTKLLEALGAEGVNVRFSEVPGALERGVIDCAVTGSGSGYASGWHEGSTHLLPLPLGGWDPVVTAINMNRWNALSDATKKAILANVKSGFEDPAWDDAGSSLQNDINCLTGSGKCTSGASASMKLVAATQADMDTARNTLLKTVLPDWASRTSAAYVKTWNESVGKVVGVKAGQ